MTGSNFIRALGPGEEEQVDTLLRDAFGGQDEAMLVRRLRKDRSIAGEMVLARDGALIGYYALSWMKAPKRWLCLAPVAVAPPQQRQGYGRRMLGQLSAWAALSGSYVVVLGQPEVYGRAGFSLDRARRLDAPYPTENLLLAGPGDDVPKQRLIYPAAFAGLD